MTELPNVHPAVAASLTIWHDVIARADTTHLPSITHPDALFRSPIAINPYRSADALVLAVTTVLTIFRDFVYHRQAVAADGLNVILEFSAMVEDKEIKGIDLMRFDEDGKLLELEVLIRPLNGLQVLAAEMGQRLGGRLPAYKQDRRAIA